MRSVLSNFTKERNPRDCEPIISRPLRVAHKATKQDTRSQNRRLVLQQVFRSESTTRAEIARSTHLTAATVSHLVSELVEQGLVRSIGTGPSAGGKPPTLYSIANDSRCVGAVDLSNGLIAGKVTDLRDQVVSRLDPRRIGKTGEGAVRLLEDTIAELIDSATAPLLGFGIATPGVIDDDGRVIEASNLAWRDLPLRQQLEDRFGLAVHIMNNSRAVALAEYAQVADSTNNLIALKIGRGVGAGIILDGRLYTGDAFGAGEIGHVGSGPDAPLCACGNRGCLEKTISVPSLATALRGHGFGTAATSDREVLEAAATAAAQGNREAIGVIDAAGRRLGTTVATLVGVLDIHALVITGGIEALGEGLLESARSELAKRVLPALASKTLLRFGTVGPEAALQGAVSLVLHHELGVV